MRKMFSKNQIESMASNVAEEKIEQGQAKTSDVSWEVVEGNLIISVPKGKFPLMLYFVLNEEQGYTILYNGDYDNDLTFKIYGTYDSPIIETDSTNMGWGFSDEDNGAFSIELLNDLTSVEIVSIATCDISGTFEY